MPDPTPANAPRPSGNQGLTDGPFVLCDRCDSSGCIEGPEAGWYELECPKCKGEGVVSGRP